VRWNWITLLSADCCLSQYQKVCESIKNWFQLIYPNLSCMLCCVPLPSVYDFETSNVSIRDQSFNFTHMFWNLIEFCADFQKQFCRDYSSLPRRSNIFIRKTLETICKSCSFNENDFKDEITLTKNLLRKESKLPVSPEQFFFTYNYLKSCVWLLLVAVTLPFTNASCESSFSKMKLVKTFPRNSMTNERLGNIDLLSTERYKLKNRFRWFPWLIWQSTW